MQLWRWLSRGSLVFVSLVVFGIIYPAGAQTAEQTPAESEPLILVWQSEFSDEAALINPGDIAVDAEGNVYISDQAKSTIKKFDSDGNFVLQFGSNGKGDGQFRLVLGMAVDADDRIYATDFYNKRIQIFDGDGNYLQQWPTEPSNSPAFLDVDGQGNVYVDKFPVRTDHYIQKFDADGNSVSEWGGTGADGQKFGTRLEDIALDADGNLYVADTFLHIVQKLDPDGNFLTQFGSKASQDGHGLFDGPFGVTVDSEGNIYVLDRHFLQKLDRDGKFIAQWSTDGGDLDRAGNVTVDDEDNLYVYAHADVTAASGATINTVVLKKFQQP